jgi:hypothetical protein
MNQFIKAIATIIAGMLILRLPSLAPYKEDLVTAITIGAPLVIAWIAQRHALRRENVKDLQKTIGMPPTGKVTDDVAVALASAIAEKPSPNVRDKALDVIDKLSKGDPA